MADAKKERIGMSAQPQLDLPGPLRETLDGYRSRRRFVGALGGTFLAFAVLLGGACAAIAADRFLRLPGVVRGIFLLAIVTALVYCLARWCVWPLLRKTSDRKAAVHLGHRYPKLEEDLVSAVELSANRGHMPGVSRSLVAAALEQIGRRTHDINLRAAAPLRPALETAGVFALVLVLLGAAYAWRPEAVRNALARLFRPGSSVPFFSYVRLQITPGDTVLARGDSVDIKAAMSWREVDSARLTIRTNGEVIKQTLPCAKNLAHWQSGPLFDDLAYRLGAGDALSDWHRVRVVPAPALAGKSAVVRVPDYAGAGERTVDELAGTLEIIQGSSVAVWAEPVARGEEPEFRCIARLSCGETRLNLKPDAAGALRSDFFAPEATGEWAITLEDGFGLTNRIPDSLYIKVTPDKPPAVRIIRPGRDLTILATESVPVAAAAKDEFGARNLALMTRVIKTAETAPDGIVWDQRALCAGSAQEPEISGETELNARALNLQPGDRVEYKAAAADFAGEPARRTGFSPVFRILVISEMDHLERVLAQLRDIQVELLRRAAIERAQSENAANLAGEAATKAVHEQSADAARAERAQANSTKALAKKAEDLLPELARNPGAPVKTMSDLERLARGIRSVASGAMKSASAQFSQAAQAKAGQQAQSLKQAQQSTRNAARELEQLARQAERMRRKSILEKLAADAERLAALQRELKDAVPPVAGKTVGRNRAALSAELRRALDRLANTQAGVRNGVDELTHNLEQAVQSLSYSSPGDAAIAEEAGARAEETKLTARAQKLADDIRNNVLFSTLPEQERTAGVLDEMAAILRRKTETDGMEAIARVLEEFIQRQTALNADMKNAIDKTASAKTPRVLGDEQWNLHRDVSEQASALHWLAREIRMLKSETADTLDLAAGEMSAGASALRDKRLPAGWEHGKKALADLLGAREKFKDEQQKMSEAAKQQQSMEAMLLLARILSGQKKVNRGTIYAGQIEQHDPDRFSRTARALSAQQSGLRKDTSRLQRMIARLRMAAALLAKAGEKMDISRLALIEGDAGKSTRITQKQIVIILEQFFQQCKNQRQGQGLAAMRMQALMQMIGQGGGGFTGGENAPVLPTSVDRSDDEHWLKTRSLFEDRLGVGDEAAWPTEFRGLLNAYFDRLRLETGD